jgi:hypothetical protein
LFPCIMGRGTLKINNTFKRGEVKKPMDKASRKLTKNLPSRATIHKTQVQHNVSVTSKSDGQTRPTARTWLHVPMFKNFEHVSISPSPQTPPLPLLYSTDWRLDRREHW